MIIELHGEDLGKPFTLTMDFTLTLAERNTRGETLDVAMGSLQFRPDTRRNMTGWPLEVRRGAFGEVTTLTSPGYKTDPTAMEETFGRFVRLMFVPIPQAPIGIGARWQEHETVAGLDEATIFELTERTATALTVRVSARVATVDEPLSRRDRYSASLEGTLEVPVAPWQPARGELNFEAQSAEGGLRAHVILRER